MLRENSGGCHNLEVFCPRCGKPLQANAAFCMHCGLPLTVAPQEGGHRRSATVQDGHPPQKRWFWPTVIGLLALIAILGGGLALLMARGKNPPLQATGTGAAPPPLTATATTMPPDIRAWLDHLRETEDRKNKLVSDQTAVVMTEYTKLNGLGAAAGALDSNGNLDPENMKSPSEAEAQKMKDLRPAWGELIQFFESMPPPPECTSLAHTYDSALDEIRGEMGDVVDIVNQSQDNSDQSLKSLMGLQGKSTPIDGHLSLADKMVGEICDKYNTARWFSIRADAGSPLSLGR